MSIQDKLKTAKPTYWVTEGIPKWKVRLIMWYAKVKLLLRKLSRLQLFEHN